MAMYQGALYQGSDAYSHRQDRTLEFDVVVPHFGKWNGSMNRGVRIVELSMLLVMVAWAKLDTC